MIVWPTFVLEQQQYDRGLTKIAGLDEAGRGPWAGPLVASAVIFDIKNFSLNGLRDSKSLSAKQRQGLVQQIKEQAVAWAVGQVSSQEIDRFGLQLANKVAMKRAIAALQLSPDYILTDYVGRINFRTPFEVVIRGESVSLSIAAASILAKVYRDELMMDFASQYPNYGFDQHKGYGTKLHQETLTKYGPCPIHRRCFEPVAQAAKKR